MNIILKASLIVLLLFSGSSNASKDSFVDHGVYTTDTLSELDWLDVTETGGQSYNQVVKDLGAGGGLEGWRYATGIEFNQMLSHYTGVTFPDTVYDKHYPESSLIDSNFFRLFGNTSDLDRKRLRRGDDQLIGQTFITGIIGDIKTFDSSRPDNVWIAYIYDYDESVEGGSSMWGDHTAAHYIDRPKSYPSIFLRTFASFLVRDTDPGSLPVPVPVPVPAAVWFMASGLLGLVGVARNRKNK